MWIDAMLIDQSNDIEKGLTVAIMSDISSGEESRGEEENDPTTTR